ncbi:pheromone A receptor-domain-containing protein [Nemania diffusa]|nr:pheromone A receptor-domain-containing protein [Nemania diffusa]
MEQAPATNPGLLANFVLRVILAFAGILISWVPLRLLVRNGEFAAVVFIVDVAVMNFITILNSVIWHDDNWSVWWDGAGLCDVEVYLSAPLQTIYAASIFTVMYHLAQQVKLSRVGRGRREMTRRHLLQAAIIFPVPLVQLAFTYFDLAQRYIVGTLIGCSAVYDVSWPKNLVYDAPPAVFAVLSVPYAILLWRRYRAIARQAKGILKSSGEASIRANRTRRRLYNMSLSILVVYVPVMVYYLIFTIYDTHSSYRAYDFNRIRWSATPYPWDTIMFVPSWIIPSAVLNQPWIPIATSAVIVAFFGTTVEAQQMYRKYAEYVPLGSCFRKPGWWRRGDQALSSADESGGTRESGKTLLPNRTRGSIEDWHKPNSTIERPENIQLTNAPSSTPSPAHPTLRIPPTIPPRFSSLRPNFAFRAPTLQSLRRSLRLSPRSASGGSNETTRPVRDDSIPMLPVHAAWRHRRADSRSSFGSFLARDIREASSPVEISSARRGSLGEARAGGEVQVRVPIVRTRRTASWGEEAGMWRGQTVGSLCTLSDMRTDESYDSAGRDVRDGIGIAK